MLMSHHIKVYRAPVGYSTDVLDDRLEDRVITTRAAEYIPHIDENMPRYRFTAGLIWHRNRIASPKRTLYTRTRSLSITRLPCCDVQHPRRAAER